LGGEPLMKIKPATKTDFATIVLEPKDHDAASRHADRIFGDRVVRYRDQRSGRIIGQDIGQDKVTPPVARPPKKKK
jgi:hypothetical protein